MWYSIIVTVLVGYMLGNLNGAVCISALMNDDVRSHGSGNAGLTNFIRNYGAARAFHVFLIDAGKAALACVCGGLLLEPFGTFQMGSAIGGLALMLGHAYPVLLGFRLRQRHRRHPLLPVRARLRYRGRHPDPADRLRLLHRG